MFKIVQKIGEIAINAVEKHYGKRWLVEMGLKDRLMVMEEALKDFKEKIEELYEVMPQEKLFDKYKFFKINDLDSIIKRVLEKSFNYYIPFGNGINIPNKRIVDINKTLMENCTDWKIYKKGKFIADKEA